MNPNAAADDLGDFDIDLDLTVEADVAATPEALWAVIWDLDRFAEWNPECVEAQWADGASAPAVGATFTGRNELFGRTWTVTCHITECSAPTRVCWTVGDPTHPSSTWTYTIGATDTGCRVTERFVHGPGSSGIRNMIRDDPANAINVIAVRGQMLEDNMTSSLRAIAMLVEERTTQRRD